MTINIEWQDQFDRWHHYQSKQNQADASRRASSRVKRYRLVNDASDLLDLLNDQGQSLVQKKFNSSIYMDYKCVADILALLVSPSKVYDSCCKHVTIFKG